MTAAPQAPEPDFFEVHRPAFDALVSSVMVALFDHFEAAVKEAVLVVLQDQGVPVGQPSSVEPAPPASAGDEPPPESNGS